MSTRGSFLLVATVVMVFSDAGDSMAVSGGPTDQIRGHIEQMYQLVSNATDQEEFVRLFADVFERAYLWKIQLADAEHFAYLGDTIEGEQATVRTAVTVKSGSVIKVDYRARLAEGGAWRVYDLNTEGISLVGNYRTQFNSIITRSSYSDLVKRLRAVRQTHTAMRSTLPSAA